MFDDMQKDIFTGKYADFLGRPLSKKEVKKRILAQNREKGRRFEEEVKFQSELQGYEVQRTPRGKDFIRRRRNPITGRVVKTEHIEVKSGNSKISKLQSQTKKKKSNYKVIRGNPLGFI